MLERSTCIIYNQVERLVPHPTAHVELYIMRTLSMDSSVSEYLNSLPEGNA